MAIWWVSEAAPLGVVSLLPLILYPAFSILDSKAVAVLYFNSTIFLFLGGFLIAAAMERWNLHKRISLLIVKSVGGGPSRLIFGFMAACLFLSMFITNTATAIMMTPIAMAVVGKMEEKSSKAETAPFAAALMLGIAYSCSIGGIATFVGTVPNLVFREIYSITFPDAPSISFAGWMLFGVPLALVMLFIVWFVLAKLFYRISPDLKVDKSVVDEEYESMGAPTFEQKAVFILFIAAGLLWIFRKDIDLEIVLLPGWSNLIPFADQIDDATVAIFVATLMFLIPSKDKSRFPALLDSKIFGKIPWEILLLFGGGFALAKGFQSTGLSELIGGGFRGLEGFPQFFLILSICLGLTFLTELTSNTATTQTMLPILASLAIALEINPLVVMVPATISASFAFMLPVATPPNAIVFSGGKIKSSQMASTGLALNIIGAAVIAAMFSLIGDFAFGADLGTFPDWARP